MHRSSAFLGDDDLLFLIRVLIPGCTEVRRMLRTIKEDEDILEGMLADEKLFRILLEDPQSLLQVSAHLFFTVLLNRVKHELNQRSYTVETDFEGLEGSQALVFDSAAVVAFLEERGIRNYLADMLVSFVRINSYTIPVRIRKGIWRKYRFSDYDIDSLLRYSEILSREQRFPSYKRIADICLFTRGIFPDPPSRASATVKNRRELENYGRYFYKAAADYAELMEHPSIAETEQSRLPEITQVLLALSEQFVNAVKPLTFMANHYLEPFRDELFLQS